MRTILFCGGGTMGPVTPLLAVLRQMRVRRNDLSFAWVGTPDGPERPVVEKERVTFYSIPVAKLPRYVTIALLRWPFDYLRARRAARELIDQIKPSLVVGTGGFMQVAVMRAARRRNIPCAIHQLDKRPTLSNKLVAKFCASVTTSFSDDRPFDAKAEQIATPCRFVGKTIPDQEAAADRFLLDHKRHIVFILGGGTGAQAINRAIDGIATDAQIIHSTGLGKKETRTDRPGYVVREFFDERDTLFAYAAADLVICRAGMATLSELAALSKPAIVIPIPDSHQEENAEALKEGIEVVRQTERLADELRSNIPSILEDPNRRTQLGATLHKLLPTDDGSVLAERWIKLIA